MSNETKLAEALREMLDAYDGPNKGGAADKMAAVVDARHALVAKYGSPAELDRAA